MDVVAELGAPGSRGCREPVIPLHLVRGGAVAGILAGRCLQQVAGWRVCRVLARGTVVEERERRVQSVHEAIVPERVVGVKALAVLVMPHVAACVEARRDLDVHGGRRRDQKVALRCVAALEVVAMVNRRALEDVTALEHRVRAHGWRRDRGRHGRRLRRRPGRRWCWNRGRLRGR